MRIHVFCLLSFFCLGRASAQPSVEIPPPSPPFVAKLPENGRWIIKRMVSQARDGDTAAAAANLDYCQASVSCIKTGDIKHDTATYTDGKKTEAWYVKGGSFVQDSFNPKKIIFVPNTGDVVDTTEWDGILDLTSSGFPGMAWIQKEHYIEAVDYQGKPCFHFKDKEGTREAWVDAATKLPIAFRLGSNSYLYYFGEPPASQLVLPREYAAVMSKAIKFAERKRRLEEDAKR